jgi:SAM-dependent methyltransferase
MSNYADIFWVSRDHVAVAGTAEDIARFFDREACCAPGEADDAALTRVSAAVLAKLEELGLSELSVLDVGCGTGALSVALARGGARSVTGVDLSPQSIAVAEQRRPAALADRVVFTVGDGAAVALETHDVVVLNKVVCCYFDPVALLDNTARAAQRFVLLAVPASRGVRGLLARASISVENVWHWLRRRRFRGYVHDTEALRSMLGERAFDRVWVDQTRAWQLEAYAAR